MYSIAIGCGCVPSRLSSVESGAFSLVAQLPEVRTFFLDLVLCLRLSILLDGLYQFEIRMTGCHTLEVNLAEYNSASRSAETRFTQDGVRSRFVNIPRIIRLRAYAYLSAIAVNSFPLPTIGTSTHSESWLPRPTSSLPCLRTRHVDRGGLPVVYLAANRILSSQIAVVLRRASQGSSDHLRSLGNMCKTIFATHGEEILKAILPILQFTPSATPERSMSAFMAMQVMTRIHYWYSEHQRQAEDTLLQSVQAISCDCIDWAQMLLKALVLNPASTPSTALMAHGAISSYFGSLFRTPLGLELARALAGRSSMLNVAIQIWVAQCEGYPSIYPSGNAEWDADDGLYTVLTISNENPQGLAQAIMEGHICPPDAFVDRTLARLEFLTDIGQVKHLSRYQKRLRVEKRYIKDTLSIIYALSEADIRHHTLFRKHNVLGALTRALKSIPRRIVSLGVSPSTVLNSRNHVSDLFEVAEHILEFITDTLRDVARLMRSVVDGGFLYLLGPCLQFVWDTQPMFDSLLKTVLSYSTYPGIAKAIARDFPLAPL
ncbi:hypothetical protein NMY22_g11113 [Coprinellus aureogranulatus]|nr:hypothetical protein NMY22_g11113 [Coprinellus aureogranulatus]